MRVSLELPEAGTCVALVAAKGDETLALDLLDDVPEGELLEGSTVELFMPHHEGVYHWLCTVNSPPLGQKAEVHLLSAPLFIQRRLGHRVGTSLPAEIRREHSSRRGRAYPALVADLSRGGLGLDTSCPLNTGDTVEVTMDLSGTTVRLMGRVAMAHQTSGHSPGTAASCQAHVSFFEGQRGAIEAINHFVSNRLRYHELEDLETP